MSLKKKSKKWVIWVVFAILLTGGLISTLLRPRQAAGSEVIAVVGNIQTFYSFSGSVEAKNRQTVFAQQAVRIRELNVGEGDAVAVDDLLYTTSGGENVKAKINGEVLRLYVQEGEQLMPGNKVMEIVDYSDLQLVVKVDEYDLSAIKNGVSADVTIHALGKEIEGRVSEVSREGVHMNGVTFFTAVISLEADVDILVGMSAEAKVLKESADNVVTLSMAAVQFDSENNPYVYINNGSEQRTVNLILGITDGFNVEVKSGLAAGDVVFVPAREVTDFDPPGPMGGGEQ